MYSITYLEKKNPKVIWILYHKYPEYVMNNFFSIVVTV